MPRRCVPERSEGVAVPRVPGVGLPSPLGYTNWPPPALPGRQASVRTAGCEPLSRLGLHRRSLRPGRAFPGVLWGWARPSGSQTITLGSALGPRPGHRLLILIWLLDVLRLVPVTFPLLPSFHSAPYLFLRASGPVSAGSVRRVCGEAISPEGKWNFLLEWPMEGNREDQLHGRRGGRFGSVRGRLPSCEAGAHERWVLCQNHHSFWMPSSGG